MAWFDFIAEESYRKWFEKPRFEAATEPKESWLTKAYETYQRGVETAQRAPAPPSAEQLGTGMTAAAERLRETAGGLGVESLAATATPLQRRRAEGRAPAQATAGFPYEPETQAARGRLTESLRTEHPEWSEEQLSFAATSAIDPGEGFMPMAAWGQVMRPAFAAMAYTGAKAAAPVARGAVAKAKPLIPRARDVLMEEAGGLKPKQKMVLTNDIRTPMQINTKLNELAKLKRLTKAQKAERIRLYAEKDLNELRAVGDVESQMDTLLADIKEMGEELELRAVSREYKPTQAPQFGTAERVEWQAARAGKPKFERPTTQFSNEPRDVLEGRLKAYQEFADNMKIEALKPGEEHLVTRARFTERGEVIEEPTFATEGEIAGVRPQQAELGIGAGERPLETAGPMFARQAKPPKPAAQAFREATEPRALEEALELGGMGTMEEIEASVGRGLQGRGRGAPPRKPPTAEAAGGMSAESAGNRFVAPLREFDDVVAEVVTSENPVVRALVGRTGLNPSILRDTPTGKALTSFWRQRVSSELLSEVAVSSATDAHAQMFTGRMGGVLRISTGGEIRGITVKPGQSRMWQDVFSRPGDYTLPSNLRAYIDDYLTVVRETEAMRVGAGLKPRAITSKEGWFYVPRQVKGIRGVDLRRPSNPGLQRIYEEAQEGVAAGIKYSESPRATLEIHVRAAYREVSEAQLSAALEPLSIAPKGLIREPIRIRMEKAVQTRLSAERQLRALNREYLKAAGKGKPGWPKREAGLGTMREGLLAQKATVQTAKESYWRAKKAYTRAMESARKAEVAPGNLFGQAEETIPIASWRNRFFPREQADALNEALGSFLRPAQKANPMSRGLEITGNYVRFLASVGDFAMPFIQGLPTFAYRPTVWARMTVRHYQAFFDPTVQARFMRQHIKTFQKMAQHGSPIGDPEFFAALTREGGFSAGKILEILPKGAEARKFLQQGGKQTFGRFQASYNTGLASNRALLYESLQPTWKGTEAGLWQFIKNMTGGLDSRALGVGPSQRGFESVWMAFSPRLLRSTASLIVDAARPTTPQGKAALKALAGLTSAAAGIYVLTGLQLGKSWEEIGTGLNPMKGKRFLAHEINGDWIGIGGQVRAITQFMAHSLSSIAPGGEPIDDFISTSQFDNPILRFYSSRGAPAKMIVGGTIEATTGLNVEPYDQVDTMPDLIKHIGTSALPFTLQGHLEGEQWGTSGAALVGWRTSPETVFEKRNKARDETAQQMFGKPWEELLQGQQNEVRDAEPALRKLETEAISQGAERGYEYSERTEAYRAEKDEYAVEGARVLEADPTGREWAGWRKATGIKLNTTWEMLTERFGIKDEPREAEFLEDRLAERYWNLEPDRDNDGIISTKDWKDYDKEVEHILNMARRLGVSEEYIKHGYRGKMWPNHPQLQSIEEEYQQAKEIAREYYDIPAKIGVSKEEEGELRSLADEIQDIATSQQIPFKLALVKSDYSWEMKAKIKRYRGLPENPKRAIWRQQNREKYELYRTFYSDVPLGIEQPEMAMAGVQ